MNEQWVTENLPCKNNSVVLVENENGVVTMGTEIVDFVTMFAGVNITGDIYTQMKSIGEPLGYGAYVDLWHSEGRF